MYMQREGIIEFWETQRVREEWDDRIETNKKLVREVTRPRKIGNIEIKVEKSFFIYVVSSTEKKIL